MLVELHQSNFQASPTPHLLGLMEKYRQTQQDLEAGLRRVVDEGDYGHMGSRTAMEYQITKHHRDR